MKTCLSRDEFGGKPGNSELTQRLEGSLQNYLQTHFSSPAGRPSEPLLEAIILLKRLASSAETDEFSAGLTKLLGSRSIAATAIDLIEDLANVFCPSTEGIESELLKKSLQEALLFSIDVQGDATIAEFTELLRGFLGQHGTTGLIRLFVGLHMFNTTWLELLESHSLSPRTEEALGRLSKAVEETCFARVDAAIAAGLVS